jgi:predicted transglutaminase-like cysteine proteinase
LIIEKQGDMIMIRTLTGIALSILSITSVQGAEVSYREKMNMLDSVQNSAKFIKYVSDAPGTDMWSMPTTEGDCEDIALWKRDRLISMGFAPNDIEILIVTRKGKGRQIFGHAVVKVESLNQILDLKTHQEYVMNYLPWLETQNWKVLCVAKDLTYGSKPASKRC